MEPVQALPRYISFGEALTDLILAGARSWTALPGGSCWNVARVVARMGVPTAFAGAVSRDVFGDDLVAESAQAGLDARFMQQINAPPLLAFVASSSPPSYFFMGAESADLHFRPDALPNGWREAVEVAHFGGISLAREPLASLLLHEATGLHAAGKRIGFDPNFRDLMRARGYQELFRSMAPLARYIKVSDDDLLGLYPGVGTTQALASLRELSPRADILLTRGKQGMTLFRGSAVFEQAAFAVSVIDTVGCGDAAMGGWIAGHLLHPEEDPASHLRRAAATAALAATRAGPYAPGSDEVRGLLDRAI